MPNIALQPTVKKLRFLPSAELSRYVSPTHLRRIQLANEAQPAHPALEYRRAAGVSAPAVVSLDFLRRWGFILAVAEPTALARRSIRASR